MSTQPAPIEVFSSYADVDEPFCIELDKHLSQLQRNGLITTFHKRKLAAGTDWTKALDEHLNIASIILLLISSDFLASDYCSGVEVRHAFAQHDAGNARVIPILLRPCDWQGAPFGELQPLPSNRKPITMWRNRDEAFADIAEGIRVALQEREHLAPNTPSPTFPHLWNLPYSRNPMFTGREDILSRIHTQLQTGQTVALSQPQVITGLGGIGKTQIAVEFAYQHRQDYQAVFWTLSDTRESLVSGYVTIAGLLDLPQKNGEDQRITVQAVIRWLTAHTSWLLILDNVDDLTLAYEFLPPRFGGHLLLTTRAQATGTRAQCIEVDTMPQEVGALFLLRRAKQIAFDATLTDADTAEVATARGICEELGGLPLALDQAGAYIEETECGLVGYQSRYRVRRAEMLNWRGKFTDGHPEAIATTWSLSFEKVEQKCPAAAELLRLCTFLSPDAIPEEIITEGTLYLGPVLEPVAIDPLLLDEAIRVLRTYSLIRRDAKRKTLSIHRLVQAVLRESMSAEVEKVWKLRTMLAVHTARPNVQDMKQWDASELWLPHALVCATWIEEEQMSTGEATRLLKTAGSYLDNRARYAEAEPLYRQALAICEQALGQEHPDTGLFLTHLATLYRNQGKFERAEPLYQRALMISEQMLGQEHPNTAACLNNLAMLYTEQGSFERAEPLCQQALAIWERLPEQEYPALAQNLSNLATLYRKQGKYKQAEPLYQQALAIWERLPEQEYPALAESLTHLAVLYQEQGKYKQAEPLAVRSLKICEQMLGPEHPHTGQSLHNLGILYQKQGKYAEAEPLCRRSLAICEQVLGQEHPKTASSLDSLAELYRSLGKYAEAEPLCRRSLAICEQVLGPTHPDTATSLNNLALLYKTQGKYAEAEPLYRRSLAICEQVLGQEHPNTASSLNNLALLYQEQGKYKQAKELYQRSLEICEQVLGLTHPDTVATSISYLGLLQKVGKETPLRKRVSHKARHKMTKQSRKINRKRK